jgi:hypothetical protein
MRGGVRHAPRMTTSTIPAAAIPSHAPLRIGVHALIGVAISVVAPFTALAWPFAMLVGVIGGSSSARRLRGERTDPGQSLSMALLMAVGVLGMLFFGAIIGGIVAIIVVVLTHFSETAAALASPTDRGVARIIVFLVPIMMWLVVFPLLGLQVDIRIGG